jgi:hypothetical protein
VATQAQTIDVSFDRRVDFSAYHTYSWGASTPAPNPLTHQRIITGVEERLAAIGWRKVDADPDVLVIYNVAINPETKINAYAKGGDYGGYSWGLYGFPGGHVAGGGMVMGEEIETIEVGQLVIDIADVKTKNFVWRGSAKDTLKDRDPDKIKKKVEKAISKLFKNFPPRKQT